MPVDFDCIPYPPHLPKRGFARSGAIIIIVVVVMMISGHGEALILTIGTALLTAAITAATQPHPTRN